MDDFLVRLELMELFQLRVDEPHHRIEPMEGMDEGHEEDVVRMSAEVVHPFVYQHLRIVAVILFADDDIVAPTEGRSLVRKDDEPASVLPLLGMGGSSARN